MAKLPLPLARYFKSASYYHEGSPNVSVEEIDILLHSFDQLRSMGFCCFEPSPVEIAIARSKAPLPIEEHLMGRLPDYTSTSRFQIQLENVPLRMQLSVFKGIPSKVAQNPQPTFLGPLLETEADQEFGVDLLSVWIMSLQFSLSQLEALQMLAVMCVRLLVWLTLTLEWFLHIPMIQEMLQYFDRVDTNPNTETISYRGKSGWIDRIAYPVPVANSVLPFKMVMPEHCRNWFSRLSFNPVKLLFLKRSLPKFDSGSDRNTMMLKTFKICGCKNSEEHWASVAMKLIHCTAVVWPNVGMWQTPLPSNNRSGSPRSGQHRA